jgi:hypothetical protein
MRPAGRGLGEAHGGAEVTQTPDGCTTLDRPAVDVGLGDLFRHVLEGGFGHLAEPPSSLRQRPAAGRDASLRGLTSNSNYRIY